MSTALSIKQKKEWAKLLYTMQRLNQKQTAEKVGVSPKTMNNWVQDEKWDDLRASLIVTKQEQLRRLYAQINEINTEIESRPEGKRYALSKEADTLVKLTASAKALETESSIAEMIAAFTGFINWLRLSDLLKAQEFTRLQDEFIKTLLK
jgi:transcriptional regulator with XRE-family HTH domain